MALAARKAQPKRPDPGALLAWYDRHRRRLPWRAEPGQSSDPYRVWLSEIMLQQTTVAAVGPYFHKFLGRFPNVTALADAPSDTVMRLWAGLGYYARARNLHACAKEVAARGGTFPDTEAGLLELPGIGPYTAAAIAAIAFNEKSTVVDGNVERVITRLYAVEEEMPRAKPIIRALTEPLVPSDRPGDFAQAMMDLGATICTPKSPACSLCPWTDPCEARALGIQESFPRKAAKGERPARFGAAFFVTRKDGAVLLRRRAEKGLLGGMTEIPGSDWLPKFDKQPALEQAPLKAEWRKLTGSVNHVFSHFSLELQVFAAEVAQKTRAPENCWWSQEVDAEALPSVMRKVVDLARR
ncbi:A/G-specific adenine glycosylase [Terrihabitans soli]|uniref:Adenine DNA glycosylase n=1 Tax=Terrihabitans soli TaxID=708113 RepID=A0A6S6QIT7_9HYPH|nr:A/G-specific adenine glycosylase [Terrihabitans soli]BCJ90164.1 A/G-specific adenine glycosylase [Terrihabitans soli]